MCGILGIVGTSDVAAALYDGLTVLQHRGQDAAGIATANGTALRVIKGNGLVRDAFKPSDMVLLHGRVGIGHCRYPTAGSEGSDEAQPFYVNSPFGIALAHNGNLINTDTLRREVFVRIGATSTPNPIPKCCSTCSRTNWTSSACSRLTRRSARWKA